MSQYLKCDQKDTVLELIKHFLVFILTDGEIICKLENYGYEISERILRRYKSEIKHNSGISMIEVFQNEVFENFNDDILTIRMLQRIAWNKYLNAKGGNEKFKALSLIRNSILDKLFNYIPRGYRITPFKKSEDIDRP